MFKLDLQAIKKIVIEQLKGAGVKLALKKFLGSAAIAGPKAWVIKFIAENLFDELMKPLLQAGVTYIGYRLDVVHGKNVIKKLNDASEANDGQAYDDATDDVFGTRRE